MFSVGAVRCLLTIRVFKTQATLNRKNERGEGYLVLTSSVQLKPDSSQSP